MRKSDEEEKKKFFRTGTRFFCADSQWYYTTREGDEGPFRTEELARRHLRTYLDLESMKSDQREKVETIRSQKVDADPKVWNNRVDL